MIDIDHLSQIVSNAVHDGDGCALEDFRDFVTPEYMAELMVIIFDLKMQLRAMYHAVGIKD